MMFVFGFIAGIICTLGGLFLAAAAEAAQNDNQPAWKALHEAQQREGAFRFLRRNHGDEP